MDEPGLAWYDVMAALRRGRDVAPLQIDALVLREDCLLRRGGLA